MWHFHSVLWLMLKSHWPAFEQTASGPPCRLEKGHKEHAPEWRPRLLPWHRNTEGWRGGGGDAGLLCCQNPDTWAQTKKEKTLFSSFLSHPVFSSVSLPGRQALSMSEYCLYTCTHTHRQACALSVTLFRHLCLCPSLSWLCCAVCGCMAPMEMTLMIV